MYFLLTCRRQVAWLPIWIYQMVAELIIFQQQPEHIDAEAIDTTIEPETHHIEHRLLYSGIAPVQIWLFHIEQVQVVLSGLRIELPGRTAKIACPVIGRTTIGGRIVPDVPVAFRIFAAGTRFLEPGMFIRGMIGHEVQDNFKVAAV